ncbi:MAG TPA: class I SAM-dependent methyltransferase [Candidatus Angelobacter sp.]|nr:class I SAM-dependent methyltransferase [Candidatus Angelobacter sp.]
MRILGDLGFSLNGTHRVLDFGCGQGRAVNWLRHLGHNVVGCDIIPAKIPSENLRMMENGRIPFDDDYFDLVISEQVFEHVKDYDTAIREVHRVLKPGGITMHLFPARYWLAEPHVLVPLGSFFRPRPWLWMWAHFGIRSEEQAGMTAKEVYRYNVAYLRDHTNYPSTKEVRRYFESHFPHVEFREDLLIKNNHKRAAHLWPLARRFPAVVWLYRNCRMRVVVCRK